MAINPISRLAQPGSSPHGASSVPMRTPVRRGAVAPLPREERSRMVLQESGLANTRLTETPGQGGKAAVSLGFVSTYGPTKCGLATFTASLAGALDIDADDIGVISCVEEANVTPHPAAVVAEWVRGSDASLANAVSVLNRYDAVVVQHEFGIFGGPDGEDILELVSRLDVPVIVVLHPVLPNPSPHQPRRLESPPTLAARVVAQSEVPRARLRAAHEGDPCRVARIHHARLA